MLIEKLKAILRKQSRILQRLDQTIPGRPEERLKSYRDDPSLLMRDAGFSPDPWQVELLRSNENRILINAARQVGKSQGCSFKAINTAVTIPGSTTLIVAPVEDQASE